MQFMPILKHDPFHILHHKNILEQCGWTLNVFGISITWSNENKACNLSLHNLIINMHKSVTN